MFLRVKRIEANGRSYEYLHLVESVWQGGTTRQRIVASLGRLDERRADGTLQRLAESIVRLLPRLRLLDAQREGTLAVDSDRVWGPVLIFERLWEESGLKAFFEQAGRRRHLGFSFERCVFALVLQRLLHPGSDRQGADWIHTVEADGFESLRLPHFYKALTVLWRLKEKVEQELYQRGLDLFNQEVDVVFFDTTSTYFEGTRWEGWAKRGKSRDHRPDHLQLMIGVVMRRDGWPLCCEIWPGNKADVTTLEPILDVLKKRFRLRQIVVVCDRGMVSAANLRELSRRRYQYIVGMRMRRLLEVRENVLRRAGRYREVQHNLHVKEVWVGSRRYVVCFNPDRAEKDRQDRAAILEKLAGKLARGTVKALIPNAGYRRFLKVAAEGAIGIDPERVRDDARYDGKFVLRTNTDLSAVEVAEAYRQLTWIERLWREMKDVMEVRPIYHHQKRANVTGHIFVSFLALYLSALLRHRLDAPEGGEPAAARRSPPLTRVEWEKMIRDLSQIRALRVHFEGARYLMRTAFAGDADKVFRAVGVRPPPLAELVTS